MRRAKIAPLSVSDFIMVSTLPIQKSDLSPCHIEKAAVVPLTCFYFHTIMLLYKNLNPLSSLQALKPKEYYDRS